MTFKFVKHRKTPNYLGATFTKGDSGWKWKILKYDEKIGYYYRSDIDMGNEPHALEKLETIPYTIEDIQRLVGNGTWTLLDTDFKNCEYE